MLLLLLCCNWCPLAHACSCVWERPAQDMALFPKATSYSSQQIQYTPVQTQQILARYGAALSTDDDGILYYHVMSGARIVGSVLCLKARGQYGMVNVAVAISGKYTILRVIVQRHREPVDLTNRAFLRQFDGKSAKDRLTVNEDITPIKGYVKSSQTVVQLVKKVMVICAVINHR